MCLPCPSIAGAAYVKAKDMPAIQRAFEDAEAELLVAKQSIVDQWSTLSAHAKTRMGKFEDEVDLPDMATFIDGFWIKLHRLAAPAPISGNVFESMNDEVAARIKADSEKGTNQRLVDASAQPARDQIKLMGDAIKDIPKAKRLRQERFDKIALKIDEIKNLNWSDNAELDHLHRTLMATLHLEDVVKKDYDGRADLVRDIKSAKVSIESALDSIGV